MIRMGGVKVQSNTQKRTESELQLWEITAPKRKQPPKKHKRYNQYRLIQTSGKTTANTNHIRRNTITNRPRSAQSIKRRQARRRRVLIYRCIAIGIFALFLAGVFQLTGAIYRGVQAWIQSGEILTTEQEAPKDTLKAENPIEKPEIIVNLLDENPYSRPGTKLDKVNNIFVHYTANKGTSAAQNRSYFANLAESGERSASAHFIIGYEGEILQCIPLKEEAYAVKGRNGDSVSIECCYLSEDGAFTPSTYSSLVELLAWLCREYGLSEQDILRHYDEGGKKCPLYYVDHEDEWEQLLKDVAEVSTQQQ